MMLLGVVIQGRPGDAVHYVKTGNILYSTDNLAFTFHSSFSINTPPSSPDTQNHVVFANAMITQFI